MAGPSSTVDQNLLPVQAYFDVYGNFQTFIGQGQPFYAIINPSQSGLNITNSTINSTTIGAITPSTGVFTDIKTTTGQISTAPSANNDIVNKLYVDTIAQGLNPKGACKAGTLTNITLSGLQTIDGYSVLAGNRVLVKNQGTSSENGIYIASASAWTRAVDMDVWAEVPGAYTVVLNGSQANTAWVSTSADTGTINVTPITFVQFSGVSTYYAGTGLTLASNTFSISNTTVVSGTYGTDARNITLAVNAQGQITSIYDQPIAIANTQVSGLGTMSTQNANAIAVTGGSIDGTTVGATTASTVRGTTITATTQFSGPGTGLTGTATSLSIGGNAATATSAGSVTNSITFNNGGTGGASGSTFNGGSALTVSYNTIGAPSITGTNASGTWNIGITGNSATVTNGVYTSGSYSNPTWITSILGSIVSGAVATATLATTATNIAGGAAGSLPYQSASGSTTFLALGTTNYVLTAGATAPQYVAQSTLSVGSATTATTATNLAGGLANQIAYQTGAGATSFITVPTNNTVLSYTTGGGFAWTTPTSYATVTDDTTTNATRYPLFANQTTGNLTTEYTSSTKYQFNPSTGVLTATGFSGSGASLTSLTAGNLSGTIPSAVLGNSTLYIGTTAVLLNAASGSITSLSVNISGSAASATTATTATNATNVAVTDNTSSSATWYPTLVSTTTGNLPVTTSSTKLSFVPSTGVLSANGVALTGNLGTVTSVAALTLGTTGTDLSSTVATGTTTPVITLNVPTASATNRGALSSADWTTFNGKAPAVTYTTNYVPYGQGTTTPTQSANLQFNGTNLAIGGTLSAWSGVGNVLQITGGAIWGGTVVSHHSLNTYFDGTNYKYLNTDYAADYYQYQGTHVWRTAPSGTAGANITSFPNSMTLDAVGNLALPIANSGITFNKTGSLANSKLNDYEEGTYTPVATPNSGSITSYTSAGSYTKIGRLVSVQVEVYITNNGTGAGNIFISLPFTNGGYKSCGSGRETDATGNMLQAYLAGGGTGMSVFTYNNNYPGGTNYRLAIQITYSV